MSLKLRGGNFTDDVDRWFEDNVDRGLTQAGFATQGELMTHSPVREGTLQRGWYVDEPRWEGRVRKVSIINPVVYARRRQYEGSTAGYVDEGIASARPLVLDIIRDSVSGAVKSLWVKG